VSVDLSHRVLTAERVDGVVRLPSPIRDVTSVRLRAWGHPAGATVELTTLKDLGVTAVLRADLATGEEISVGASSSLGAGANERLANARLVLQLVDRRALELMVAHDADRRLLARRQEIERLHQFIQGLSIEEASWQAAELDVADLGGQVEITIQVESSRSEPKATRDVDYPWRYRVLRGTADRTLMPRKGGAPHQALTRVRFDLDIEIPTTSIIRATNAAQGRCSATLEYLFDRFSLSLAEVQVVPSWGSTFGRESLNDLSPTKRASLERHLRAVPFGSMTTLSLSDISEMLAAATATEWIRYRTELAELAEAAASGDAETMAHELCWHPPFVALDGHLVVSV